MADDVFPDPQDMTETRQVAQGLSRALTHGSPPLEGMLVRFVALVDWEHTDGNREIIRYTGDTFGGHIPPWEVNGMLDYGRAPTGSWEPVDPESDEE